jgi:hypothetical protein
MPEDPVGVPLQGRSSEAMPEPVPDVVADHRAHNAHHEHNVETELAAPNEEARDQEHRLLGNWDAGIA